MKHALPKLELDIEENWDKQEAGSGDQIVHGRDSDVRAISVKADEFLEEVDVFALPIKNAIDLLGADIKNSVRLALIMQARNWVEEKRTLNYPEEFVIKNVSLIVKTFFERLQRESMPPSCPNEDQEVPSYFKAAGLNRPIARKNTGAR